ncbi:MAG: bifunctional nuclease family protein [Candidatus Marinimicrobia bacterium]|jgi:hypothetical protein|nr:bifunctional nuclease family protein [Candidatus Neomarinimicrobiota bacterium]MBT3947496.1 bifunctional nuclease family protein [Candidatus Neomarinimicrobiota bacterium]MBT4063626.1 bifunctional nuclease family protein [Candidatus Neomarinimicrobiota bacterium]MBT4308580.1 bifunctional nuclease family protein [Candidatus Neomarinimicrobiota bacterium]MBT4454011.1 bifunctional nuclease family protein [Candidatus Neomarinimicrobiota bacterium]|tara:strand:+ start:1212 stop:1754 length:543 start_codon:yes stop_codon:yes gene_type:complete
MIPVKVQKISYYHPNRSYAVILKELSGERRLPVLVGAYEAQAIAMAMEYMETPRPLTHDLIVNTVHGVGGKLSAVKITKLENGVFYSILDLQVEKLGNFQIDSRPSDALAVALRMHSPIMVAEEVMGEAIVWEEDLENIEEDIQKEPKVELLERQLEKAIDKEEYEMAARIRDKINKIDN